MAKFSCEEKLEAVLRVLDEGMSERQSAHILGCAPTRVHEWCQRYRAHGLAGLLRTNGTYTGNFKLHVLECMHTKHLSCYEVAAKFMIPSVSTVINWERIYYEEGTEGLFRDNRGRPRNMKTNKPRKTKLTQETEEDLIAEVQRLRMENDYLKKLQALVQERIARENGNEPPSSMN